MFYYIIIIIIMEIAFVNPHARPACNCRRHCTLTYQKWVLTILTAQLFYSGRFCEISHFELFHFTLCCGWREEEDMKSMLSLTQGKEKKKKTNQETLDFYTPVEIICQISEVINSSSSLPNGTQTHNLPYGRFLSLG